MEKLTKEILLMTSSHYGFDIKSVKAAFNKIKSFDGLISMCENTKKLGGDLKTVMKIIDEFDKWNDEPERKGKGF